MFEQAKAGCVAAAKTPAPTTATTATTAAANSQRRCRWRNDWRAAGRDRSRRPARDVPVGLLERGRSPVRVAAGVLMLDVLAAPGAGRRSFAPGTLSDGWPAVR
jgi:hypothetical protein